MSSIISNPFLYFSDFCLHMPSYASACMSTESCAPHGLNFGSMPRSGSLRKLLHGQVCLPSLYPGFLGYYGLLIFGMMSGQFSFLWQQWLL